MANGPSNPPFPHNLIQQFCQGTLSNLFHFAVSIPTRNCGGSVEQPCTSTNQYNTPALQNDTAHTQAKAAPDSLHVQKTEATHTCHDALPVPSTSHDDPTNHTNDTVAMKKRSHMTAKEREQHLMRQIQMCAKRR